MNTRKGFVSITLLVVSICVFLTPTEQCEAGEKIFKLGILGPFSGPSARTGEELKGAATMAFDAIHWQIGEYKIEPIWIDSQSDPGKAIQEYEHAVAHGIQAGILGWHSAVAVTCMEVTAKYKIPHFFAMGATEAINEKFHSDPEKYGYWIYKGWPIPQKLSISYVQALEDAIKRRIWTPAEKTVAIYGENAWGRNFGQAIKEQLEQTGWTIVDEDYFSLEQTEFYPLLNKLKKLDPAVIAVTSTSPSSVSAFINQADEIGLPSLMIVDGLGWIGEWYELAGKSSNYVIDQVPGWTTEQGKRYAAEFEKQWGTAPSPATGGLSYDGTNFFIAIANAALEQYGELSGESIYSFVKEHVWTGKWTYTDGIVMNTYAASPETIPDPVVGKGYYIFPVVQYFDGVGKVIFPPEWAEQELRPKP